MKAGDYFEFQLPGNLKPNKPGSGDLVDAEGNVYGTYTLVKMVRFVLPLMSESRLKVTFTGTFL